MYILYFKELYIVNEAMRKNRCHQSWRGKQLMMCEEREPLQQIIDQSKQPERYYIEEQPH